MDIIKAIILGIIEGLTEFLPVSSTGHMILTAQLLDFTGERAKTFEIVVQLGAVLAVAVLYWRKFVDMLQVFRKRDREERKSRLNLLHVILALVPAMIAAFAFHGLIKKYLFGAETVLGSLVVGALLMIVAERSKRQVTAENVDDISYRQAFGIGVFQCLALWPGFSRSGSTISGGILLGTSQKAAAEFTFLVSVPIMFGATGYDLYKSREYLSVDDIGLFIAGLGAAFIVGMIAVVSFIKVIKRVKLSWFAYYRFALAAVFYLFVIR